MTILKGMHGGVLPFEFGGEAVAGPAGVGVGLEEAEMADGGFAEVFERDEAVEGVEAPAGLGFAVALPVERGLPAFGAHGGPALGEPELGAVVAVLVDEGEVLGAGDGAGGEVEGLDVDGVAGGLVVEGEGGGGGGVEGEADLYNSRAARNCRIEGDPFERGGDDFSLSRRGGFEVGGVEGVGEESVLDVCGDELLMLLLVFEAQGDAAGGLVFEGMLEERGHGGVDVCPVGEDGVERRAGEGGAELLFGHVAEGVVVAVEEPVEVGMEGFVGGDELAEDEGLEEPAGVGEMPLDGAGFGTGLDHEVFRREWGAELAGRLADGFVAGEEEFGGGSRAGGDGHDCSRCGGDVLWMLGWGWTLPNLPVR